MEIADALDSGHRREGHYLYRRYGIQDQKPGTVYDYELLPSYSAMKAGQNAYAESFYIQYSNTDPFSGKRLVEPYGTTVCGAESSVQATDQEEMDEVYALPYMRNYHPSYEEAGGVPAIREMKFSLISNRGCFGACSFCALTFHQGRIIQARSHESLVEEAEASDGGTGF